MTFFVGQKVVCIYRGRWFNKHNILVQNLRRIFLGDSFPVKGHVYLVREMRTAGGFVFLHLSEFDWHRVFVSDAFRPLVDTKTDISVFTRLLSPSPVPVSPDLVEAS